MDITESENASRSIVSKNNASLNYNHLAITTSPNIKHHLVNMGIIDLYSIIAKNGHCMYDQWD